jgi:hypothetical protein
MVLGQIARNAARNSDLFVEALGIRSRRVLFNMLGPVVRMLMRAKGEEKATDLGVGHRAHFDWTYEHRNAELARLYEAAKHDQWNAATDVDWSIDVDPQDTTRLLAADEYLPLSSIPEFRSLPVREQNDQKRAVVAWMLSQFLHGEQGALFAACQVTEAVGTLDGKLYGSTQVVDEGRHVEVFYRYLTEKLEKLYEVNDNLYVILDALLTDRRWDVKFLGMQIMVEGLALGAFGTLRATTKEPLLRQILGRVITDEARHVHYGVVALRDHYRQLPERERREREDWAYEVAVLLRNRFLAHEFYEEYYAHKMSRREWNRLVLDSPYMELFRRTMFKRLIPNLKRIGLLGERIRPHYASLGLLQWEGERAAPDLTAADLLAEGERDVRG